MKIGEYYLDKPVHAIGFRISNPRWIETSKFRCFEIGLCYTDFTISFTWGFKRAFAFWFIPKTGIYLDVWGDECEKYKFYLEWYVSPELKELRKKGLL